MFALAVTSFTSRPAHWGVACAWHAGSGRLGQSLLTEQQALGCCCLGAASLTTPPPPRPLRP